MMYIFSWNLQLIMNTLCSRRLIHIFIITLFINNWTRLLGHTVLLNQFEDVCFYSIRSCVTELRWQGAGEGSGSGYVLWLQVLYRTTVCPIVTVQVNHLRWYRLNKGSDWRYKNYKKKSNNFDSVHIIFTFSLTQDYYRLWIKRINRQQKVPIDVVMELY